MARARVRHTAPTFTVHEHDPAEGALAARLAHHAEEARRAGRRAAVMAFAAWADGAVAITKNLEHPAIAAALDGATLVLVNVDDSLAEAQALGFGGTVPAFYPLGPAGELGPVGLTGGAWGPDVPLTIGPALETFLRSLPAPAPKAEPAPPATAASGSPLVGIALLLLALALVGGGAYWKVTSSAQAEREERQREQDAKTKKDIEQSIRRSLENQRAK